MGKWFNGWFKGVSGLLVKVLVGVVGVVRGVRMLFVCSITTKQPINTSKEPINTPEGRVLFVDTKNHIRVPECYVIDMRRAVYMGVYGGVYRVFGGVLDVYVVYI